MLNGWKTIPETAAAKGESACNRCGKCCERAGCSLLPGDAERIATHLGLTLREFVQRHTVFVDGRLAMRTPCNFYVDKLCTIDAVKPAPAREFACWDDKRLGAEIVWPLKDMRRMLRKAGVDSITAVRLEAPCT